MIRCFDVNLPYLSIFNEQSYQKNTAQLCFDTNTLIGVPMVNLFTNPENGFSDARMGSF